jgi:hypothetical protein
MGFRRRVKRFLKCAFRLQRIEDESYFTSSFSRPDASPLRETSDQFDALHRSWGDCRLACDTAGRMLIEYLDAVSFTIGCLTPGLPRTVLRRTRQHDAAFTTRRFKPDDLWTLSLTFSCSSKAPGVATVQAWRTGHPDAVARLAMHTSPRGERDHVFYHAGSFYLRIHVRGNTQHCPWFVWVATR